MYRILNIVTAGLLFCESVLGAAVPTPEMAISYALTKDTKPWVPASTEANSTVILQEWVPKGDSIDAWKEMFDQKILFTKASIREHLDAWKALFARVDAKVEIKEEKNSDGSVTVAYTSIKGDEMGISRFFKANDGLYIFSYRVRPGQKDEETLKIWRGIISSASLVKNPLSKKN